MSSSPEVLTELLAILTGTLDRPGDWQPLLQLASETLTIGSLAATALNSPVANNLPGPAKDLLTEVLQRCTERNKRLRSQFEELLSALNKAGIEPIVMRGMAALLERPAETGRLLSDVDVLIPRNHRDQAVKACLELGYEIFQGFHGPPHAVTLGRSADVGMIDLHTDIQPYSLAVDYDRVASLCSRTQDAVGSYLLPEPTCTLLFYILHDQLHDGDYWRGLIDARHLVEMPRLVSSGIDWDLLASFFPRGSPRNAMHVHLRTATALMYLPIPAEHCCGFWAAVQVRRRKFQMRVPRSMPLLTILSLVVDPPQSSPAASRQRSKRRTMRSKLESAFRPVNAGKVRLG